MDRKAFQELAESVRWMGKHMRGVPHTDFIRGKDITVKGITVIGGLDGPLGTLAGKQGVNAIEHGCVDRVER